MTNISFAGDKTIIILKIISESLLYMYVHVYARVTHVSFAESLWAGQVNKVELRESVVGGGEGSRPRLNVHREDAVRAGGVLIEGVLPNHTISLTLHGK